MIERLFSDLGRQIERTVRDAVNSKSFADIKDTVNNTVREAARNSRAKKYARGPAPVYQPYVRKAREKLPAGSVSGILLLIFGFLGAGVLGISLLGFVAAMLAVGMIQTLLGVSLGVFLPLGSVFSFMIAKGSQLRGRVKRYRRYREQLAGCSFCSIGELAEAVGKPPQFVAKDLTRMMRLGMFPDGHIDRQQTCLMLGEETYHQYLEAQKAMEERKQEEERKRQRRQDPVTAAIDAMIEEGRDFLRQIREADDALPEAEISQKLLRLEEITAKIFEYVEQHPNKLPEIRKFISYYLPTTLKLVNAYRKFDSQPIQGENITQAKKEIRQTLDTINVAFENLLNGLFRDDTLDVSTDISVLETMLAQEGLVGRDFGQKP